MPTYLLELYVSRSEPPERFAARPWRITAAAARAGESIRYVRSLFLTDDETCFHVFEARSPEVLATAAHRAGLSGVRVTEAVETKLDDESNQARSAPS
jgi:hypothetical protein